MKTSFKDQYIEWLAYPVWYGSPYPGHPAPSPLSSKKRQLCRLFTAIVGHAGRSVYGQDVLPLFELEEKQFVEEAISDACAQNIVSACVGVGGLLRRIVEEGIPRYNALEMIQKHIRQIPTQRLLCIALDFGFIQGRIIDQEKSLETAFSGKSLVFLKNLHIPKPYDIAADDNDLLVTFVSRKIDR